MNIADDAVPLEPDDPLDALPDNGGAQMTYVKRFRHIRTAVVNDDYIGDRLFFHS